MNLICKLVIFLLLLLSSCMPKQYRLVRKEFRHDSSNSYLTAFYYGTVAQDFLYFKENGRFYQKSSALFWSDWYAGNWSKKSDTIYFQYDQKPFNRKLNGHAVLDSIYLFVQNDHPGTKTSRPYINYLIANPTLGKYITEDDYNNH